MRQRACQTLSVCPRVCCASHLLLRRSLYTTSHRNGYCFFTSLPSMQYKFDALITTYEMVLKDADELRPIK